MSVKIPHVAWRKGRPRFSPSPELRAAGHRGHDLKHADGTWLSEGEALDWSRALARRLAGERKRNRAEAAVLRAAIAPKPVAVYTVAMMMQDWLASPAVARKAPATLRDYRQKVRVLASHWDKVRAWDDFDHRTAPEGATIPEKPDRIDRAIALVWISDAAALNRPICYTLWEQLFERRKLHTANAVLTCLGMAIEYAQKKGRLPEARNPAHKLGKITPKTSVRHAEPADIEALIAAADRLGRPEIGDMVALGVWVGQRQKDRLELRLDSLRDGRFTIAQSKTGARVSIPLAPALEARLKRAAERRRQAGKILGHAVVDEILWAPFKADWYRHVFAAIRAEAARERPQVAVIRDKDLRATAVMWLARAGATNTEIASITGHTLATVDQILKHYWAATAAQADDAMAKMIAWHIKQKG